MYDVKVPPMFEAACNQVGLTNPRSIQTLWVIAKAVMAAENQAQP